MESPLRNGYMCWLQVYASLHGSVEKGSMQCKKPARLCKKKDARDFSIPRISIITDAGNPVVFYRFVF